MSQSHSKQIAAVMAPTEPSRVTRAILDFVSEVPTSKIGDSADPAAAAQRLASRAAQRAALAAGSLALPPGPLGWLTLLPELIAIWRIQAQMVSDIAAAYGRHATLGRARTSNHFLLLRFWRFANQLCIELTRGWSVTADACARRCVGPRRRTRRGTVRKS